MEKYMKISRLILEKSHTFVSHFKVLLLSLAILLCVLIYQKCRAKSTILICLAHLGYIFSYITNMKIAVGGACGRLGSEVCKMLETDNIVVKIDLCHGDFESLQQMPALPDIIVDVSCAANSIKSCEFAAERHIPIIIACTGHNDEEKQKICDFSAKIPIFLAYNTSLGVQILKQAAKLIAEKYDCDIHIHEVHHINKKDAPSGTAKEIERVISSCGKTSTITSARGGSVVGEHTISFFGRGETLEIKHTALSREAFASGIKAAVNFMSSAPNGLYNMQNLQKKE